MILPKNDKDSSDDVEITSPDEDNKTFVKTTDDDNGEDADDQEDSVYQVFILNNGTAFLESIKFVQSSKNVEVCKVIVCWQTS